VGSTHFFCAQTLVSILFANAMTHPLVPPIIELATPVAAELGLEVVTAALYTHHRPPSLRVDVRHPNGELSLDDCARMSQALELALDAAELIPHAYTLEVSSPGVPNSLTTDREFEVFNGFTVMVKLREPLKGKTELKGQLKDRDETTIHITQKGRIVSIPRELAAEVVLDSDD
jgi:ribosome maturation factor RimP